MNIVSPTRKIELMLKRHQIVSLDDLQPKMAIECKNGVIWVTASKDINDYVLDSGGRYIPTTRAEVVIEAMADSSVDIEEQ
jgi:hypothetical protein